MKERQSSRGIKEKLSIVSMRSYRERVNIETKYWDNKGREATSREIKEKYPL